MFGEIDKTYDEFCLYLEDLDSMEYIDNKLEGCTKKPRTKKRIRHTEIERKRRKMSLELLEDMKRMSNPDKGDKNSVMKSMLTHAETLQNELDNTKKMLETMKEELNKRNYAIDYFRSRIYCALYEDFGNMVNNIVNATLESL